MLRAEPDGSTIDTYVTRFAEFAKEGFGRVWLSQLPTAPDLLTVLAVVLREVPNIQAGSAVLPIQTQHPMGLAQRALTLNAVAQGRFSLGIGMSHQAVTENFWGISWDRPVRRMNEYLDGLLPLLAGERADVVGEFTTTRGAMDIPAVQGPAVYLAALGPQMLAVAGRRTAGTVTWMTGPKTLSQHVGPRLRQAAAEGGRQLDAVRVVATLPVAVTDDSGALRRSAAEKFKIYGKLPSYRAMLDREGHAGPADAALIGDEATVAERIAELRDAGVDEFVGIPFEDSVEGQARTRALLRSCDRA